MAASEVAVSLAIIRLHDLLSKSKDIITYQKLTDQISDSINNLQGILNTRKHAEVDHDHYQENPEGEERLLRSARGAEQISEEFLVKLFRHQISKWKKGRFTKVFDLVRFFSVINRGCARKKMAKDFMTKVSKFTSPGPPARGLPANKSASSSSSSKRNQANRQRVETDIVGRDQYVKDLLAWLINDDDSNLRLISVVGEQACGKTALVRSVFSMLEVKHHFDCCVWVRFMDHWAESDRMKNLLVDILKQTPLRDQVKDLDNKQEEQLFEMLHKLLMDLRYLIVVDDLGEVSLINELLVPFVDSSKGSRVIVTTTNGKMRKFADPWTPKLRLLPEMTDEECKKLLRVSITGDNDSGSEMTILEQKILSKCNHSPPAISLLGGLLSAVEQSNWVALINRLGDRPTLDDVTRLSFDELPYMMKPRVLYMALFPKESVVPTRRLFRQWAAEGLLAGVAADGSVRMQSAEDCFRELESRYFIQVVWRKLDGSARSCRMPAFIHEFFYRTAKELGLLQILYSSDSASERESRRGMDPEAEQSAQNQKKQAPNTVTRQYGYEVQCLQTFASFNTSKLGTQAIEIEDLLQPLISGGRPDLLRVLDLEGVYKPELPKDFGNTLSNLRYLGLRWTVLYSIPGSVENLLLLETLDLKHTNVTKVTSAIWNAKNLRHLYLSEASFDESIPRHISSESKLETLWGLSIKTDESPMISVLENLKSLKKLGVTCCPGAVKEVIKCVCGLDRLESLRLRSRDLVGQPASLDLSNMTGLTSLSNLYLLGSLRSVQDLSVLPGNLRVLTLSMSELKDDPMEVLQCLKDLIVLRLLGRSCTYRSLCCKAGFPKLRVLKLWMLEELEELKVEQGAMCTLEELDIRQCKELKEVTGLIHIKSLKFVSLTRVKEVLDPSRADGIRVQDALVKTTELLSEESAGKK